MDNCTALPNYTLIFSKAASDPKVQMTFCNVQISRYLNFEIYVTALVSIAVFRNAIHCRSLSVSMEYVAYKGKVTGGTFLRNVGIYSQITWCLLSEDNNLYL
jgi:hypothetical protein